MNLPALSLVFAACILAAVIGLTSGWKLEDAEIHPPGVPRPDPVQSNQVDVQPIRPFPFYYGRKETDQAWRHMNPFVPYDDRARIVEKREHDESPVVERRKEPVKPPVPPTGDNATPVRLPEKDVPAFDPSADWEPVLIGGLEMAEEHEVMAATPEGPQHLRPGDTINGWELLRIRGYQAFFRDPDGRERKIPIGMDSEEVNVLGKSGGTRTGARGSSSRGGRGRLTLDHPMVRRMLERNPRLGRLAERDPEAAQAWIDEHLNGR